MICGEEVKVKVYRDREEAITLHCRRWSCPNCDDQRKRELIALAHSGNPTKFLTLTHVRRSGLTADQAACRLADAWRRLRRHLIRKHKLTSLPFLCVIEAHKSGWPHMHILLRGPYLPQPEISDWMRKKLASPVVDIRAIDDRGKVGGYIAKYVGKAPHRFKGTKRYWRSQDYDQSPVAEADADADRVVRVDRWSSDIEDFGNVKESHGWQVQRFRHKVVAHDPQALLRSIVAFVKGEKRGASPRAPPSDFRSLAASEVWPP